MMPNVLLKIIKKMANLNHVLDSIISTTNVEHWREQRKDYQPAFSLNESLKHIIPISEQCSKEGVNKLWKLSNNGSKEVNINEFFLNETHSQLQKAMFGFSDEFENRTNKKIRDTFNGENEEYRKYIVPDLLSEVRISDGPLSKAMKERSKKNLSKTEEPGNALIFSFAGHDTTGNTLTWLIYEISKNQQYQTKLQEVDDFWINQKTEK